MNNKFSFNLSNKIIFSLVSLLFIFILTLINNYYFYSHVKRTSTRNGVQLEKLLLNHLEKSINKTPITLENEIIETIKTWNNYSYYISSIKLINLKNESIFLKKKAKWDRSVSTDITINMSDFLQKKTDSFLITSVISYKMILDSVIKSMTFSIAEIYEDITKQKVVKESGQVILIENVKANRFDGIININNKKFEDRKTAKYVTLLNQENFNKTKYYIPKYSNLNITKGTMIQKGEILAEGSLHTAIENFNNIYLLRSRPFIGFFIFTILILKIFESRKKQLDKNHQDKLDLMEQKQTDLEKKVSDEIEKKEKALSDQNKLKSEYEIICNRFNEFEDFVKFAFEETTIDEMLNKNNRALGTMFRLIAEKIVFDVFENKIRMLNDRDNLDSCIREIKNLKILSRESISGLYAIKQFGNQSVHYSKNSNISNIKAIVIAKELIEVLDDYLMVSQEWKDNS